MSKQFEVTIKRTTWFTVKLDAEKLEDAIRQGRALERGDVPIRSMDHSVQYEKLALEGVTE